MTYRGLARNLQKDSLEKLPQKNPINLKKNKKNHTQSYGCLISVYLPDTYWSIMPWLTKYLLDPFSSFRFNPSFQIPPCSEKPLSHKVHMIVTNPLEACYLGCSVGLIDVHNWDAAWLIADDISIHYFDVFSYSSSRLFNIHGTRQGGCI